MKTKCMPKAAETGPSEGGLDHAIKEIGRSHPPHPRSVLVVEDDPGIAAMLNTALQLYGFTVWTAKSGLQAIDFLQQHHAEVGVVLMDVHMPTLDGPETLSRMQWLVPDLRCCMMTGYLGKYTAEELLARGVLRIFQKPFAIAEVARVLGDVVAPA
jgi:two-component system, cell cycle sensor histidine kinase and response regulator CckA